MDTDMTVSEDTRLLGAQQRDSVDQNYDTPASNFSFKILPIPFLAAMAIAATAATEMFAYAAILCKDPKHCQGQERTRFAGTVSVAVIIANVCSLFALGPLVAISKRSRRIGLISWTICRSMSVVALALGVYFRSVLLVLSGRVFEGSASDNLLHFNLGAIYVLSTDLQTVARLIEASLALYMIGICLGPLIAGALPSFQASFYLALALFVMIFAYILLVPTGSKYIDRSCSAVAAPKDTQHQNVTEHQSSSTDFHGSWRTPLKPLLILKTDPKIILPWLSLLCYNLVQSFTFMAIMTYTTLRFGFTGRENGLILSVAHAVAATYLIMNSFVLPRVQEALDGHRAPDSIEHRQRVNVRPVYRSASLAVTSILMEAFSLVLLGLANKPWQIYLTVVLLAVGLSTPSFIKSYVTTLVPHAKAGEAIAVLTMAETLGSLLAPVVLGALLASRPPPVMLFVASGVLVFSSFALAVSVLSRKYSSN